MTPAPSLQLATRRNGSRDGELMLLSANAALWRSAAHIAPTLQALLDDWHEKAPQMAALRTLADAQQWAGAEPFDPQHCRSEERRVGKEAREAWMPSD